MHRPLRAAGIGLVAALTFAPVALATSESTPRQDAYYDIWCTTAEGSVYLAKQVNANAIQPDKEPGGKDTATARFNANNPFGESCEEDGPIQP